MTALVAARGVWAVRVHDVPASVDAVTIASALRAVMWGTAPPCASRGLGSRAGYPLQPTTEETPCRIRPTPTTTASRLSGITAVGFTRVLDFEKRDGQPFTVDATLYTDFADAAAGDDLEKTTNYAQVAELIHQKIVFARLT